MNPAQRKRLRRAVRKVRDQQTEQRSSAQGLAVLERPSIEWGEKHRDEVEVGAEIVGLAKELPRDHRADFLFSLAVELLAEQETDTTKRRETLERWRSVLLIQHGR